MRIEWQDHLRGFTVEWADEQRYVLSQRNMLYATASLAAPLELRALGAFPSSHWQQFVAKIRPAQRLLRFLYYNVIRLPDNGGLFVTFKNGAGIFRNGSFIPVSGFLRPSKFLRGACAMDRSGGIYMGEYASNPGRTPVLLYHLPPRSTCVEVVHEFAAGTVRHVHGVFYDSYENHIWCTTGDREKECQIIKTADGFRTFDVAGKGDETWRAVSLVVTPDHVYYGMDAEFRQNYIFRIDKHSGRRESLGEVDGPVYYSRQLGKEILFGVSAEGCPSQVENRASLWAVQGDTISRILSIDKDAYPRHFMPGTFHFNLGPASGGGECFCYCNGLKGADQRTVGLFADA
jgi:hypothetical protein